jgi:hypothetical protein
MKRVFNKMNISWAESTRNQKEETIVTEQQRFSIDENSYLVDRLNPANSGKVTVFHSFEKVDDEKCLREKLLYSFLADLVGHLIVNSNPTVKLTGEEYRKERHTISWALYTAVQASHLNTLDIAQTCEHRFSGEPKRKKEGMQDFTSLSLFADDVERLLRDLYGDGNNEAIDLVRRAVFQIVQGFTQFVRKDLWQEHNDAETFDYINGIGLPEGCGLSGSDLRRAWRAAVDVAIRARTVRANPTAFSKYTVAFVKVLAEEFPWLEEQPELFDKEIARLEMERDWVDELFAKPAALS